MLFYIDDYTSGISVAFFCHLMNTMYTRVSKQMDFGKSREDHFKISSNAFRIDVLTRFNHYEHGCISNHISII